MVGIQSEWVKTRGWKIRSFVDRRTTALLNPLASSAFSKNLSLLVRRIFDPHRSSHQPRLEGRSRLVDRSLDRERKLGSRSGGRRGFYGPGGTATEGVMVSGHDTGVAHETRQDKPFQVLGATG